MPDGYRGWRGADAPATAPGTASTRRSRRCRRSCATIPGLMFDRMRWRRQKRLHDGVRRAAARPAGGSWVDPARWWFERELQIRRALRKPQLRSRLPAGQPARPDRGRGVRRRGVAGRLAGAAFRPPAEHRAAPFQPPVRRRAGAGRPGPAPPIGRAAARPRSAIDGSPAQWYRSAPPAVPIAYYGQLAAEELGERRPAAAAIRRPRIPMQRAAFESQELVRVARMLIEVGRDRASCSPFLLRLAEQADEPGRGRPGRRAGRRPAGARTWSPRSAATPPITATSTRSPPSRSPRSPGLMRPPPGEPEPALLLGVARQESVFNPWVSSHAGAQGLLQLIPRTAFLMARALGLPYNRGPADRRSGLQRPPRQPLPEDPAEALRRRGGARRSRLQRRARAGRRVAAPAWRSAPRRSLRPDRLDRADPVRRDPQLRAAGARGAQHVPAPARQRQSGHGVVPPGQRAARAAAVRRC